MGGTCNVVNGTLFIFKELMWEHGIEIVKVHPGRVDNLIR